MSRLTARQRLAAIVLAVVAACFITLDVAGSGLDGAHGGVRGALGALYRGTDGVIGPVRGFVQGLPSAGTNHDKIAALRHENAALTARLAADAADARTRTSLSRMQLAADTGRFRVLPARVIALGPGQGFDWTVTLDAGSRSGVRTGQSVTDGVGLVGRVLHTSATSCVVLLAADAGSGVGVRDMRTGELAVVTGQGPGGFRLAPLDPAASLRVGDALQTGPAGGSTYVAGLAIGTITAVHTSADGAVTASVRPAVSATALDLVGVILGPGGGGSKRLALNPSSVGQGR
jgi:rod shape-determining protein MreC